MKHLISPLDLSVDELDHILALGQSIMHDPQAYAHVCDGKKLATLFYEPSTRTRLSFEAAMMKAVSSIELGMDTLTHKPFEELTDDEIVAHLYVQDAERVFCVYEALKRGVPHETIYDITKIDWWFLDKMQHLADLEKGLAKCNGVLSLVSSLLFETQAPLSVWTPSFIGAMAFLSVGCTCVALLIQNVGLAHVPASTGSLLLSMESPSGALFSVLLMGEALTSRLLAGFALIFLSIILSETHFDFLRRKSHPQL